MSIDWAKLLRRKATHFFPVWNFIEYLFVHTTFVLINAFPINVSTWMARRIGDAAFLILLRRRKVALNNLTVAFGNSKSEKEKKRLTRESFRNLATCFMEFFRSPKFAKISEKHIQFQGVEHIERALAKAKGLILVMSHLGPWEYLGFIPYLKGYRSAILGKAIKNPYLYRRVKALRRMMNLDYIDKDEKAKKIFSLLKKNYGIAIAIDQWAGNEGIWVDFFGKPTSTTSVPAELAKRTGCTLLPAYCVRLASGEYQIHIEPEVLLRENDTNSVENTTKELNSRLEDEIRAFPEQWMWTHKRWKDKRTLKT